MAGGYMGKLLFVDLSKGTITEAALGEDATLEAVGQAIAHGSLMGARGNKARGAACRGVQVSAGAGTCTPTDTIPAHRRSSPCCSSP